MYLVESVWESFHFQIVLIKNTYKATTELLFDKYRRFIHLSKLNTNNKYKTRNLNKTV